MSDYATLEIEILNGPLDGARVTLVQETDWTRGGAGPLAFPWDEELGDPQARFSSTPEGWQLVGFETDHGTYRLGCEARIEAPALLAEGDVLRANETWLRVSRITAGEVAPRPQTSDAASV